MFLTLSAGRFIFCLFFKSLLQSTNVKTVNSDYQAVSKEWLEANCGRDDSFCLRRKKKKGNIMFCDNYATFSQSWLCSALLLQCKNSGLTPGHHMKLPRLNKKQNGIQNTGLSLLKALFCCHTTKNKKEEQRLQEMPVKVADRGLLCLLCVWLLLMRLGKFCQTVSVCNVARFSIPNYQTGFSGTLKELVPKNWPQVLYLQ